MNHLHCRPTRGCISAFGELAAAAQGQGSVRADVMWGKKSSFDIAGNAHLTKP